jgi:hypothetical protein
MLHCQMMRDASATDSRKQMLPYFREEVYTGIPVLEKPDLKVVYAFLKKVFDVGNFNPEACVICLVYINRLIGITGVPLTEHNWKPITISALVLAQKVWDDTPLINADFHILYPAVNVDEINFLERKYLSLVEFKLGVSQSLYAQYYFELRSISEENIITFRPQKPITSRLSEKRVHLSVLYQRKKQYYKKRTMTEDRFPKRTSRKIIS